jgi:hypothetical protein
MGKRPSWVRCTHPWCERLGRRIKLKHVLYLKCTAEVQKLVGLHKDNLSEALPSEGQLGNWYVHRFSVDRRKAFIFMSETTLLSFILLEGKKTTTAEFLPNILLAGLEQLLLMRGLAQHAVERAFQHYHTGLYAKTSSRTDLGSLNDLVNQYQWRIERSGGLAACDLTKIIMQINEMPQRRLSWSNSWDITQSKLQHLN